VVAETDGIKALEAVHAGFKLGGTECHQPQGTESPLEAEVSNA
jgi:aspartate kinase